MNDFLEPAEHAIKRLNDGCYSTRQMTVEAMSDVLYRSHADLHPAMMAARLRPDILKSYPKAAEILKDIIGGIEGGHLPKPNWWDRCTGYISKRDAPRREALRYEAQLRVGTVPAGAD